MSGAGASLQSAAIEALAGVEGLNRAYPGPPLQGAFPYAVVECGAEADWSHKGGKGRELRLAVTVSDCGERPDRVQALGSAVEEAIEAGLEPAGWEIASLVFVRGRTAASTRGNERGWTRLIEYRARLLKAPG